MEAVASPRFRLAMASFLRTTDDNGSTGDAAERLEGYCNACFTGIYPLEVDLQQVKTGFERAIAGNL